MGVRLFRWLPLAAPATVLGLLAILLAWRLWGAAGPALAACIGCLAGLAVGILLTARQEREAAARLRNADLRSQPSQRVGLFSDLLTEAVRLLGEQEELSAAATRAKTELEARSHSLRNQLRRVEGALSQVNLPVFVADARDQLLAWNDAAAELLKLDPNRGALAARPDLGQLEPAFRSLGELVTETRQRNTAAESRSTELDLPGEAAFRATARNVYEDDGSLLGTAVVLQDIREERHEKTRHAEFVSSVCHELKTPMAGIKAYIELLMDGDVEDAAEQQQLYRFIDGQVDRLTRLVNNMLNLARIESGVIKVQRDDCELNSLLQKAVEVIEPTAEEKQITVLSELSEMYIPVHVDPDLFGQAVINLLSNAVKYTPSGGEVRLRSRMDENAAVIEVRDTGMGIPEHSLPHLFERFYRVPENSKAAAGTGLGLALVHYIVTNIHNGEITVASKVNEGSCFTITVPLGHQPKSRRREPALCTA